MAEDTGAPAFHFFGRVIVLGLALLLYRAPTSLRWVLALVLLFAMTALAVNLRRQRALAASVSSCR